MNVGNEFGDELPNVRKVVEALRDDPSKVDRLYEAMEDELDRRLRG